MSTLYELTGQYLAIYEMDIDDETKQDTLASMDWEDDFVNKAEGYAKIIKNLEADLPGLDEEIKRLQDRKNALKNKIDTLKTNLQTAMEVTGNERIELEAMYVNVICAIEHDRRERIRKLAEARKKSPGWQY